MDYYQSEEEIRAVVQGFESCATAKEDFKHAGHLTVAVWYLLHSTPDEALKKMRSALHRFLEHHGVGREKYHETLTVFWIKLVEDAIGQTSQNVSPLEKTNMTIERLSDPRTILEYYSEVLLRSSKAARAWIPPDVRPLNTNT